MTTDLVPLSVEAAEKLTADIESGFSRVAGTVEKLVRMLTTASELRVWAVLGYESWETYVKDRFDGSRSRLWRAIDQAQVTMELAAAAGVKPVELEGAVSGRAAQEIKDQLPEVRATVESATKGQPKTKRPAIVKDAVDQARVARAQTAEQVKRQETFASTTEEVNTYSFWFDPDADLGKKILAASKKAKMPAYDWVILAVREKLSAAEEMDGPPFTHELRSPDPDPNAVKRKSAKVAGTSKKAAAAYAPATTGKFCRHPVSRVRDGKCGMCGEKV